jgi:hypothetical protein
MFPHKHGMNSIQYTRSPRHGARHWHYVVVFMSKYRLIVRSTTAREPAESRVVGHSSKTKRGSERKAPSRPVVSFDTFRNCNNNNTGCKLQAWTEKGDLKALLGGS